MEGYLAPSIISEIRTRYVDIALSTLSRGQDAEATHLYWKICREFFEFHRKANKEIGDEGAKLPYAFYYGFTKYEVVKSTLANKASYDYRKAVPLPPFLHQKMDEYLHALKEVEQIRNIFSAFISRALAVSKTIADFKHLVSPSIIEIMGVGPYLAQKPAGEITLNANKIQAFTEMNSTVIELIHKKIFLQKLLKD